MLLGYTILSVSILILLQCREIGYEIHEEVLKVLHELHTAMKTHHTYQAEFRQAENKLQVMGKKWAHPCIFFALK